MKSEITIVISEDFSKFPGLRYESLTAGCSGEKFRDELLIPAFDKAKKVRVVLDGIEGVYGSGFLEEVFGGLIRKIGLAWNGRLIIISNKDPKLQKDIDNYMAEAMNNYEKK